MSSLNSSRTFLKSNMYSEIERKYIMVLVMLEDPFVMSSALVNIILSLKSAHNRQYIEKCIWLYDR